MEIIRAGEIMLTHPEHQRLPYEPDYAFGGAFVIDHYCPLIEATVPITDCGFMHADAVYDVVSVSRGAFFRLEEHQDRFARACEAIRVRNPFSREEEAEILHKIVALAGLRDSYVWWAVTRGAPPLDVRRWCFRTASSAASTHLPVPSSSSPTTSSEPAASI